MDSRVSNRDLDALAARLQRLLVSPEQEPDASIIIPVNARADLETVIPVLEQLSLYAGPHALELILVVNNYDPAAPPAAIDRFTRMGLRVIGVPSARYAATARPSWQTGGDPSACTTRHQGTRLP